MSRNNEGILLGRRIPAVAAVLVIAFAALSGCSGTGTEFVDPNLSVGDTGPGGGTVVYVASDYSEGWKYLEAAPRDAVSDKHLFKHTRDLMGGTSEGLGTGKKNTNLLISAFGSDAGAATKARQYRGGGKSDWYLPSFDELELILEEFYDSSTPDSNDYLSSSETDSGGVYKLFYDGSSVDSLTYAGTTTGYVWPMRLF